MKQVIVVVLAILAPAGAMAQATTPAAGQRAAADRIRTAISTTPVAAVTVAPVDSQRPAAAQKTPPPPPPDVEQERPRRRGSMVGYIEDPVVSSKIRIRFDAGFHDDAPDRAEFFYAKCGCYRDLPPGDAAFDPAAPGPRPGAADDLNFQQVYLHGEYAWRNRVSLFAELPIRWIQPQSFAPGSGAGFPNQSGLSDLRAGARIALLDTERQLVTVQLRTFFPTGKASKGLGTDHASVEPTVLLYEKMTDRFSAEAQVGAWLPVGGADGIPVSGGDKFSGNIFFYGIGPSYEVYRSGRLRFAPVVELVGWHLVGGFQTTTPSDASGTNIVNLKVGARTSWNNQGSFYIGYGHALTSSDWYDNILRLEYRRTF